MFALFLIFTNNGSLFCQLFYYFVPYYIDITDYNYDGKNDVVIGADAYSKLFGMVNCNDVGIKENNKNSVTFSLFPNPVNDILNIDFENLNVGEHLQIQIVNNLGIIVKEEEIVMENNKTLVNTKDLQSGVYVLNLKCTNSIMVGKRFVISR